MRRLKLDCYSVLLGRIQEELVSNSVSDAYRLVKSLNQPVLHTNKVTNTLSNLGEQRRGQLGGAG